MNDRSELNENPKPWKILIADDDSDVHTTTRMALRGTQFRGRTLEFIDAFSGTETLKAMQENPDIALVFLDIIMETDDAGLLAARSMREQGFNLVRIIFRTGFPGHAPERKVILDYDIHDYKEKTGLSVQKLLTAVISALRSYDDMAALENHRRGLLNVLESVSWFDFNAVQRYVSGMLVEFSNLIKFHSDHIIMITRPSANTLAEPMVLVSNGDQRSIAELIETKDLSAAGSMLIRDSFEAGCGLTTSAGATLFLRSHGVDLLAYSADKEVFSLTDEVLLEVFFIKVCQAISNHRTFAEVVSDRNTIFRGLAIHADRWNASAADELDSLARLTTALAKRLHTTLSFPDEIDDCFLRDIGVAAMLHDVGNQTLPVELLNMATSYQDDERLLMQTHVVAGIKALDMFQSAESNPGALNLAREIVACHHERFDGTGYPGWFREEAIPLAARLVAVADAYVAMTARRPHRPAKSHAQARTEIRAEAGKQFDPRIVQAFLDISDEASFLERRQ